MATTVRNPLLGEDVLSTVLRMATMMAPGIIALLLLEMADTLIVAALPNSTAVLGVLGYTLPVMTTLFAVIIGFSMVTSATYVRERVRQPESTKRVVDSLLLVALVFGLLTTVFVLLILGFGHQFGLVIDVAAQYLFVRVLGLTGWLVVMFFIGLLRADGDVRMASLVLLIWLLATLSLGFVAVHVFGLGLEGLAMTHLVVDTVLAVLMMSVWFVKSGELRLDEQLFERIVPQLINHAVPVMSVNLLTPVAQTVTVWLLSLHGQAALVAFSVIARFEGLAILVPMVFTASLPAFVGYNYFAGFKDRVRTGMSITMAVIVLCQVVVTILMFEYASSLPALVSTSADVIQTLTMYMRIVPVSYMGLGMSLIAVSVLTVTLHTRDAFGLAVMRLIVLQIPLMILGNYWSGMTGLFIAIAVANLMAAALAVWLLVVRFAEHRFPAMNIAVL